MAVVTLVTGNLNKVKYLTKHLGFAIKHTKISLDELQSLDPKEIVEHKVRQAYEMVKTPVLVEDGSLEFEAMGRLPGPFIRFFVEELSLENICRLLDGKTRKATARTTFGYFDGQEVKFFQGELRGEIAKAPQGENGWDWDKIFIPEGSSVTRAQMDDNDYGKTTLHLRPIAELKDFFATL
ncbi:MAG TPA: non-canonical purine NTP pyrophosphatase [Candidatus Paceibacterota bacterium]|nr:non-canonical purine NTP pyrophosphatase [Candidatus Paceibacterota bacterium]